MTKSATTTLYVTRNNSWYQLYDKKPVFESAFLHPISHRRITNWDREYVYDLCIKEFQYTFRLKRLLITKRQEARDYIATIKVTIPNAK